VTTKPLTLPESLNASNSDGFKNIFKQEVAQLGLDELPLQAALTSGSQALDEGITIMVNSIEQTASTIQVRTGVFFNSVIAGCNCADDPTPIDKQAEYCELEFSIDRSNAQTRIRVC